MQAFGSAAGASRTALMAPHSAAASSVEPPSRPLKSSTPRNSAPNAAMHTGGGMFGTPAARTGLRRPLELPRSTSPSMVTPARNVKRAPGIISDASKRNFKWRALLGSLYHTSIFWLSCVGMYVFASPGTPQPARRSLGQVGIDHTHGRVHLVFLALQGPDPGAAEGASVVGSRHGPFRLIAFMLAESR